VVGGVKGALFGVAQRKFFPLALAGSGLVLALVAFGLFFTHPAARALPPAGTDNVVVSGDVSVSSRIGTETIHLTGLATIVRQDPHLESGMEVEDLQITSLSMTGQSLEGDVIVSQSTSHNSTGQIRSVNPSPQQFPAHSFFDVFIDVVVPASPAPTITLHNVASIHLAPTSGASINAWPPFGVTYEMDLSQQLTPTPTSTPAATPAGTPPCMSGVRLFPELPAETCVTAASLTLSVPPTPTPTVTPCVPTCTSTPTPPGPTATSTSTPRTPPPTPTPTRTPGPASPEDTVFSVARGDPSGFHPADLLARGGTSVPVSVFGNDNFANAFPINALPFSGAESTFGMTTEQGEPLTVAPNPPTADYCIATSPPTYAYKGATVWFRFTASTSGSVTIDTFGSDAVYDTVLAVYTGTVLNALTLAGCNDDSGTNDNGTSFHSVVTFSATAGTEYYLQAGGFAGAAGELRLNVIGPGGASVSGVHVAISCTALGLSAAGCAAGGNQDDLDALSFGRDFSPGTDSVDFSVGPGSVGAAGSAVAQQAACSPPEPQADEFSSRRDGANSLLLDGDGLGNGCPTASGLGLIERPSSDNLDAIAGDSLSVVDTNGDGLLDNPIYLSLSQGSPTLAAYARSPADILWTLGIGTPGVYASAAQLGLQLTDDIDALCVSHPGDGATYNPGQDKVLFSLAPGSPTLAALGASPADVLAPGPKVAIHAWELGLRPTDNVDAMSCHSISGGSAATVPVGDIWFCNSSFQGGVCDVAIHTGDTVTWDFSGASAHHTTTECGASCDSPVPTAQALWDSGPILGSDSLNTFSHTFTTPGTYLYYCRLHPDMQRGRIIVQAIGNPTATPTPVRHYGDANKDGSVNPIDATLVLQYSAGLLLSINPNADANGNGQINAIDATLILQYAAGLLHNLPP
jgi:hypothetical protein